MRKAKEKTKSKTTKVIYIILLIIAAIVGIFICLYEIKNIKNKDNIKIDYNGENFYSTPKEEIPTTTDFVLYDGMEISRIPGVQDVSEMEINKKNNKKYNITYYNYENNQYVGEIDGYFGEEIYDNLSTVQNVKTIATSIKYDAIPRQVKVIKEMPKELMDQGGYPDVDIHEIDLDGDGKLEHILVYKVDIDGNDNGAEPQAFSGIMLFDENYEKIADLVSLKNGFWGNIKEEEKKVFLSLDDIEYIDIDCDGVMEMIIRIPTYEATEISIVKYINGEIQGKTDVQASVEP